MLGLLEVGWEEGTLGRDVFEGKGLVLKNGFECFFMEAICSIIFFPLIFREVAAKGFRALA